MPNPFSNLPLQPATLGHACPTCGNDVLRLVAYYHGLTQCLVRCARGHWFVFVIGDAQPFAPTTGIRVLVVEPDHDLRELFCTTMTSELIDVRSAGTRADAVRVAAEWRPVVITTELMLPDGNALDWCRQLKRSREPARPAILVVTGRRPEAMAAAGKAADAVLVKPCLPDVYVREVLRLAGYDVAPRGR